MMAKARSSARRMFMLMGSIATMPSAPIVIVGDVPTLVLGAAVSGAYTHTGGASPVTFTISAGALPPGITLASDGTYSGTTTTAGAYAWTVRATGADGAIATLEDACQVATVSGTSNIYGVVGAQVQSAWKRVERGIWHLAICDMDFTAHALDLYVDNEGPFHKAETGSKTGVDLAVGGSDYAGGGANDYMTFRGRIWGAGVANGALTDDERAVLWNDGDGISFADLAASSDPAAMSLWAKIIFAWQLDEDGTGSSYADAKGNLALTKAGTVGSTVDSKFGQCALFSHAGKLRAVGYTSLGLESSSRVTYFAWLLPEVVSGDTTGGSAPPGVVTRYGGSGSLCGIRCDWVSN